MISVRRPVVGKHVLAKPAARNTHEASEGERRRRRRSEEIESIKMGGNKE